MTPRRRLALRLAAASVWAAFWLSEPGVLLAFSLPAAHAVCRSSRTRWPASRRSAGCSPNASCSLTPAPHPREASERAGGVFALSTDGQRRRRPGGDLPAAAHAGAGGGRVLRHRRSGRRRAAGFAPLRLRSRSDHRRRLLARHRPVDRSHPSTSPATLTPTTASSRSTATPAYLSINNQSASRHDPQGQGWDYAELLERTLCGAGEQRVLVLGAAGMTIGQGRALRARYHLRGHRSRTGTDRLRVPCPPHGRGRSVRRPGRPRFPARRSGEAGRRLSWTPSPTPARLPRHLLTAEFYRLARSRLADGGSIYVNHTVYPGEELFLTRAERTLRSVFSTCTVRAAELDPNVEPGTRKPSFDRNLLFRCTEKPPRRRPRDLLRQRLAEPIWTALCDCQKAGIIEQCPPKEAAPMSKPIYLPGTHRTGRPARLGTRHSARRHA